MLQVKDTLRSTVKRLSFDGRAFKTYHGPDALDALNAKEVRGVAPSWKLTDVGFVPQAPRRRFATSSRSSPATAASRVEHLDDKRSPAGTVRRNWSPYGVRHDDPDMRNVTYRQSDGRFCIVDFELATILPGFH
jgi:hypothetical protein